MFESIVYSTLRSTGSICLIDLHTRININGAVGVRLEILQLNKVRLEKKSGQALNINSFEEIIFQHDPV